MDDKRNCFYKEIQNRYPYCVIKAEDINDQLYPTIPAAMRVGIVGIKNITTFKNVIRAVKRIARSSDPVKIFAKNGEIKFASAFSSLNMALQGEYPMDMMVDIGRNGQTLQELADIVAKLRAPGGCPWDREQTHESLRANLLEECYEALEEIDANNVNGMREEFGDLLLQIILHAQISYENNEFDLGDVIKGVHDKIVRRHPHVFGDTRVEGVGSVLKNWEKIKEIERSDGANSETKGILDGVPGTLPALARAQELQDRAARVNFDWKDIQPVFDKVKEELNEVKHAEEPLDRKKELGDLLFSVVNLVRWYQEDAEGVLRAANLKFQKRFKYIELQARSQGRIMTDLSFEEMDALWNQAKKSGIG